MKKLFSIGLVSLFLLHFAGVYTYFGVRLMAIRQEMRLLLKATPDEKLELIQLTKSDYQKSLQEEDELELNGKMYDIARVEVKEGIYFVYALHDGAEDNLLGFLNEVLKRSSSDKKPVPSVVAQFLALVFVLPQSFEFLHPPTPSFLITEYAKISEDFDLIIDVPPPRG
ncbi:MAG: hypothetical protein ACKO96_25115 [Flammeovirgaceae bacterium]